MPRGSNLKRREQPEETVLPELLSGELDSLPGHLLRRARTAFQGTLEKFRSPDSTR